MTVNHLSTDVPFSIWDFPKSNSCWKVIKTQDITCKPSSQQASNKAAYENYAAFISITGVCPDIYLKITLHAENWNAKRGHGKVMTVKRHNTQVGSPPKGIQLCLARDKRTELLWWQGKMDKNHVV